MTTGQRASEVLARVGRSIGHRRGQRTTGTGVAIPAWSAWRNGDFAVARERAADLVAAGEAVDEARHVLTLVACVLADYDDALATHRLIAPSYRRLAQLDEPILWAHVHRDDTPSALAFAERRGMARRGLIAERLRMAIERPLRVEAEGVVEIPFTDDALSPFMPGFAARLNGRATVARLDTGGSFIHMTPEVAAAHGVTTTLSERAFAALRWHRIRHGVADLELGSIHLANVPVVVHEGALQVGPIARALGVELGPIIGTSVLARFLATVDAPGRRLLLSGRGDEVARTTHLGRLDGGPQGAPFALWSDHLMIVRGRLGTVADANLFVDSGLVAVTADQGQASLLAARGLLRSWGAAVPGGGRLAELPGSVAIGAASLDRPTVYPVPDATWRDFGDWGRIRVDALVSWGFLRQFTWTIDFDRMRYLFGPVAGQPR